jgi:hypothetical protein
MYQRAHGDNGKQCTNRQMENGKCTKRTINDGTMGSMDRWNNLTIGPIDQWDLWINENNGHTYSTNTSTK